MWWRRLRYVLALVALCAVATCPAAKRACTAKQQAREAADLLDYLASRVEAQVAATGRVPPTAAGPSPSPACCESGHGGVCAPDAATWAAPGWRELGFSIDSPYRYQFSYAPDATGLSATLRATGDLDCNGTQAVYEVKLTVVGGKVSRTETDTNPTE
jgi:hypothetical protein